MKILAIRGKNLASLAGDFEVDFEAEPLASAGVFAITGPTGAGKSTLLDALSLAMFHHTPRLTAAKEKNIRIPDVADHETTPQNVRNILRRGTGEGYAEVDFVGLDGERWRARWEVRRARGRADGALQNSKALLKNLDRDTQHGGTVSETRDAIQERTGLTYEQFCRSVLLAQNEFAVFLRANGTERAELLEALTGTEIYTTISKLCHQREREDAKKVDELETRLGMNPPLSQDERSELEAELSSEQKKKKKLDADAKSLKREADWHERGATLHKQQREFEQALEQSRKLRDGRKEDVRFVQRMEAIEPARSFYRDLERSRSALQGHTERRSELDAAVEQARVAHESAGVQAKDAKRALEAAETERTERTPKIRRARELDRSISESQDNRAARTKRAEELSRRIEGEEQKHAQQQEERSTDQARLRTWAEWLEAHPFFGEDSQQWGDAGKRLHAAVDSLARQRDAEKRLGESARKAAGAKKRIGELDERLAQAKKELEQARQARVTAGKVLDRQDADALECERKRIDERDRGLEELGKLLDDCSTAKVGIDELRKQLDAHKDEQTNRSRQLAEIVKSIPEARGRLEQAQKAWHSTSAIADQHTAALRRSLEENEPCPVCGSLEHPGHPQSNDDIDRLLDTLESQQGEAEEQLKDLETSRTRLEAEQKAAERRGETLATDLDRAQHRAEEALEKVRDGAGTLGLDQQDPESLQETLSEARASLKNDRDHLAQRQTTLSEARTAHQQAQDAFDGADRLRQEIETELAEAREAAKPVLDQHQQAEQEVVLRRQSAEEELQAVQRPLDLEHVPDEKKLQELLEAWKNGDELREAALQARNRGPLLKSRIDDTKQLIEQLADERGKLLKEMDALARTLDEHRRQREDYLDADDPDAEEIRLEEAYRKAYAAAENAGKQLGNAKNSLSVARTRLQSWEQTLESLRAEEDRHRAELAGWLAHHHAEKKLGIEAGDLEGLLDLLARPTDDWHPVRDELQQLDQEIWDNATRAEMIAGQLQAWKKAGSTERDAEEVQQKLEQALLRLDESVRDIARLEQRVEEDDRRRKSAADQLEGIQKQKAIHEQSSKLNELIGSSDGKKFREYAQQFALDVLIEHANAQLQSLAPRYRLQRGENNLTILVVDEDMGGEIRGVHSLSGGETFLASLALALGLSELSSQRMRLESLFIDEGFGSLDADTLRVAMDALDRLQAQGRKVGVISHVQEMSDRIGTRIQVVRKGSGRSQIQVDS